LHRQASAEHADPLGVETTLTLNLSQASDIVDDWVDGTDLERLRVEVSSEGVVITVAGSDPPPPVEELVDALAEALERPVHLTVKVIPETVIEIDSER